MESSESLDIERTLEIPAQLSALTLDPPSSLLIGSVDGILRKYDMSTWKVTKAIRGLGGEISSIVQLPSPDEQIWLACQHETLCFSMATDKLILARADAKHVIKLCEEDDCLNQPAQLE